MFSSRAGYADALAGPVAPIVYSESPPSPVPRNGSITTITTRAITLNHGAGVQMERNASQTRSDDEIILVTVKLSNKERRQSYDDALPTRYVTQIVFVALLTGRRPPKRGFLRRMSTRILPPADEEKWKAVKMPRGDYKRYHIRDRDGNYAGSEPQQEWDEEDIKREYAAYQDLPVGSALS